MHQPVDTELALTIEAHGIIRVRVVYRGVSPEEAQRAHNAIGAVIFRSYLRRRVKREGTSPAASSAAADSPKTRGTSARRPGRLSSRETQSNCIEEIHSRIALPNRLLGCLPGEFGEMPCHAARYVVLRRSQR